MQVSNYSYWFLNFKIKWDLVVTISDRRRNIFFFLNDKIDKIKILSFWNMNQYWKKEKLFDSPLLYYKYPVYFRLDFVVIEEKKN